MFELKMLTREAIAGAVAKAERYRLLNEPAEAESICRDVLRLQPDHPEALVVLLLALSDQFTDGSVTLFQEARGIAAGLPESYARDYYSGIVCERRAKAELKCGVLDAGYEAYDLLREALEHYEQAERHRPIGNDDAILRWNACVRLLTSDPRVRPRPPEPAESILSE